MTYSMLFLCEIDKENLGYGRYGQSHYLLYDSSTDSLKYVDDIRGLMVCNVSGNKGCGFELEKITGIFGIQRSGFLVLAEEVGKDGSVKAYKIFSARETRVFWISKEDLLAECCSFAGNIPHNYSLVTSSNGKKMLRKKPHAVVETVQSRSDTHDIVTDTYNSMKVQVFLKLLKKRGFKECLSFRWTKYDKWDKKNITLQHHVLYNKASLACCTEDLGDKEGTNLSYYGGHIVLQAMTDGHKNVWVNGCSGGMEHGLDGKPYMGMSMDIREGVFNKYNQCEKILLPKWIQSKNKALAYECGCLNGKLGEGLCDEYCHSNYDYNTSILFDSIIAGLSTKHMEGKSKDVLNGLLKDIHNMGIKSAKDIGQQKAEEAKNYIMDRFKEYNVQYIKV